MEIADYIWAATIVLGASFLRSFSGFGFALFAVPLLSLRLPLIAVPPMILLFDLVLGTVLTANKWHLVRDRSLILLVVCTVPGVYVGTRLLVSAPTDMLKSALGIGIIAYAGFMFLRGAVEQRRRGARGMAVVAGMASGLLGGTFGTSGPPLVMYLQSYGTGDKTAFRAKMLLILQMQNVWRAGVYAKAGLFTPSVITMAAIVAPVLAIGMWAGTYAHHRVSDVAFQRVIAALLIGSGAALLFT